MGRGYAILFIASLLLVVGIWTITLAYKYDQKLQHEGFTPLKAAFYAGGLIIALIGIAGVQQSFFKSNNFLGWLALDDLFNAVVRLAL